VSRVSRVLRGHWHNRRMPGRRTALSAVALLALAVPGAAVPAPSGTTTPAKVQAKSFAAIDASTGTVLAARGESERRPIASLTKVMTALAVIERGNLDGRVVVTRAATQVEPYREGLVAGRAYTRETLLWSALLASSNDSATALAIDAGGGSLAGFYALANAKAKAIGMTSTTYASASGLDDVRNLSTALDQALLARAALQNPMFAKIVSTRTHWTKWAAPTRAKLWVNHNKMLGTTPGTYGVKTGWTTRAGGCLVVAVRRGDRSVIGVVLASPSIWSDMAALLDVAFNRG
jgi:D-alanyl-D-alanine carboxypeptidase (penicillin-binding protein 5/6)